MNRSHSGELLAQPSEPELSKLINGIRQANAQDVEFFVSIAGDNVKSYLESLGAPLFVFENKVSIKSKTTQGGSIMSSEDKLFWIFLRTNFVTVIDNRIVMIHAWKKARKGIFLGSLAKKIIQIDFMFLEDWIGPQHGMICYKKKKPKLQNTEEDTAESVAFLLKMKRLVEVVNSDCIIQLSPATKQRGRILKRHLKKLPNVKFLPVRI